ncbi:hypothetical protein Dimus_036506 [Dionaea muscipula]
MESRDSSEIKLTHFDKFVSSEIGWFLSIRRREITAVSLGNRRPTSPTPNNTANPCSPLLIPGDDAHISPLATGPSVSFAACAKKREGRWEMKDAERKGMGDGEMEDPVT